MLENNNEIARRRDDDCDAIMNIEMTMSFFTVVVKAKIIILIIIISKICMRKGKIDVVFSRFLFFFSLSNCIHAYLLTSVLRRYERYLSELKNDTN